LPKSLVILALITCALAETLASRPASAGRDDGDDDDDDAVFPLSAYIESLSIPNLFR
jgi:hypothetical protein